jgi:hypothetical protein
MNWTIVPRITGGIGCMLVLVLGITAGIDPLLCTLRGLIGGMVGWVAGALWAFVMCRLEPPEIIPNPDMPAANEDTNNSEEPSDE